MASNESLKDTIFSLDSAEAFERAALLTFSDQVQRNVLYGDFVRQLGIDPTAVKRLSDIPFLPIAFFKTHAVKTGDYTAEATFSSSGTTGQMPSKHHLKALALYEQSFRQAFARFYGNPKDYCILALLPAYLERQGSSLVHMANDLINTSQHPLSGFYLNDLDRLEHTLTDLAKSQTKTLLLGVSFALIDLAERMPASFDHGQLTVMETGGMKGRRREMIRAELHDLIKAGLHVDHVHSEYGMTELLSQAYAKQDGRYQTPPWMAVYTRDTSDPLSRIGHEKTGGLNIIDLANQDSCAFLATEDLGRTHADGSFEVLGRFDTAEIRGCNLMAI